MRKLVNTGSLLLCLALGAARVAAQDTPRNGLDGHPLAAADTAKCPDGSYLVGVAPTQTDRVIGFSYDCVPATHAHTWVVDGLGQFLSIGNIRGGVKTDKQCPQDYFMVGLGATLGHYDPDSHGLAQSNPFKLIADLAPMCRNDQDVFFQLPPTMLHGAGDNELESVAWDNQGGARSCTAGYAVTGIVFVFDARRDLDPASQFKDAAIICGRLPVLTRALTRRHAPTRPRPHP